MSWHGPAHPAKPTPVYLALQTVLAIQACNHSHGDRRPKRHPCTRHVRAGASWAYVLEGHVPELLAAIAAGLGGMVPLQEYLAALAPELVSLVARTTSP